MTALFDLWKGSRRGLPRLWPCLGVVGLLCACDTPKIKLTQAPRYKPSNVYCKGLAMDPEVKRVAVLPMTTLQPTEAFQAGVDSLQPLLHSELAKAKRFEMIVVTPEQL